MFVPIDIAPLREAQGRHSGAGESVHRKVSGDSGKPVETSRLTRLNHPGRLSLAWNVRELQTSWSGDARC